MTPAADSKASGTSVKATANQTKKPKGSGINTKKEGTQKCVVPECGRDLNTRKALLNHYYTVHSDERFFTCETCQKSFKRKDSLKDHTSKLHPDKHLPDTISIMHKLSNLERRLKRKYASGRGSPSNPAATSTSDDFSNDDNVSYFSHW